MDGWVVDRPSCCPALCTPMPLRSPTTLVQAEKGRQRAVSDGTTGGCSQCARQCVGLPDSLSAGIQTATDGYSADDRVYVNTLFYTETVVRQVGGSPPYYCTVSECAGARGGVGQGAWQAWVVAKWRE